MVHSVRALLAARNIGGHLVSVRVVAFIAFALDWNCCELGVRIDSRTAAASRKPAGL